MNLNWYSVDEVTPPNDKRVFVFNDQWGIKLGFHSTDSGYLDEGEDGILRNCPVWLVETQMRQSATGDIIKYIPTTQYPTHWAHYPSNRPSPNFPEQIQTTGDAGTGSYVDIRKRLEEKKPVGFRINTKKFDRDVELPSYAREGDAGLDLRATVEDVVNPNETKLIYSGIGIALPKGLVGLVVPRSGLALKHSVTVLNAPGIIDSGYRGEIGIILHNFGKEPFVVNKGDRVAQLIVTPSIKVNLNLVDELENTERGDGAYGSTGSN